MPARRSAAEFTHDPCPSLLSSDAGRSGTTASSCSRVGVPPGKNSIDQPPPTIHSSPGWVRAYSATRSRHSSAEVAPCRSQRSICTPAHTGCTCASWNPGSTSPPATSTTRVRGPASAATASSGPTATTRPPVMATEPGREAGHPVVQTDPFRSTVSTITRVPPLRSPQMDRGPSTYEVEGPRAPPECRPIARPTSVVRPPTLRPVSAPVAFRFPGPRSAGVLPAVAPCDVRSGVVHGRRLRKGFSTTRRRRLRDGGVSFPVDAPGAGHAGGIRNGAPRCMRSRGPARATCARSPANRPPPPRRRHQPSRGAAGPARFPGRSLPESPPAAASPFVLA